MAAHLSRRMTLALLATAGAVVAAGGYLRAKGPEALIAKSLDRQFPGVRIDAASIVILTRDIQADRFQTFSRKFIFQAGARVANIVGIDALSHWKLTANELEHLERRVVTGFVLGSDLLDVRDPKSDLVTYRAVAVACVNRFAEHDTY
jgi:hypothetical protein